MCLQLDPKRLKQIQSLHRPDWTLWQKKNLNIHRGVVELNALKVTSIEDLAREVRECVRLDFRPTWWRGFGYGAIIHFTELPSDFANICNHIDTRNKRGGVWQWVVVCLDQDRVAVAIHTWLHGYLRPVYESALQQLRERGYECYAADAKVDVLIAKLHDIASTCRTVAMIGNLG